MFCPVYQCYSETFDEVHFNNINSLLVIGTLKDLQRAVVKWEDVGRHNCSLHYIWRGTALVTTVQVLAKAGEALLGIA